MNISNNTKYPVGNFHLLLRGIAVISHTVEKNVPYMSADQV